MVSFEEVSKIIRKERAKVREQYLAEGRQRGEVNGEHLLGRIHGMTTILKYFDPEPYDL